MRTVLIRARIDVHTPKAYLLKILKDELGNFDNKEIWIPRSICKIEALENGVYKVKVPVWIYNRWTRQND